MRIIKYSPIGQLIIFYRVKIYVYRAPAEPGTAFLRKGLQERAERVGTLVPMEAKAGTPESPVLLQLQQHAPGQNNLLLKIFFNFNVYLFICQKIMTDKKRRHLKKKMTPFYKRC